MLTYTTDQMTTLWSPSVRLEMWHRIEIEVIRAQVAAGEAPQQWLDLIMDCPTPTFESWHEALHETGHEVTAYLHATGLAHLHLGLTSSDLVDTANALRIGQSNRYVIENAKALVSVMTLMIGVYSRTERLARTHGQPAVPDTLGRRLQVLSEQIARCGAYIPDVPGKLSGPVGSHRQISRETEHAALSALGLTSDDPKQPQPTCSQIVPRDFYSRWAWSVADLVSTCAAVGLEVRTMATHGEVREGRDDTYTGSSAMPHKANPNQSERLGGLARIARSAAAAISEGIEQWQDRDLVHSSVERTYLPALAGLADHALCLTTDILLGLLVDEDRLANNLEDAGRAPYSHDYLSALLREGVPYRQAVERTTAWLHEEEGMA